MQLKFQEYKFTLLTPCFSGTALGKNDDHAEMRIPPIRGHVRFWHRELFKADNANRVWGSTSGDEGQGSRVALRFVGGVSTKHAHPRPTMLPHKNNPNQRGPRPALAADESFTFHLQRLVGCTETDWQHAQAAVKLWLLLGCLGLRSNRAAGSVWPLASEDWPEPPATREELKQTLMDLKFRWPVSLIGENAGKDATELRETASDTINDARLFGSAGNTRKPSPTKFKVIRLGQTHCLLATAPSAGGRPNVLPEAYTRLQGKSRWQALGPWHPLLP
ncbi:MAG TPA: hypothetical protein PLT00_14455 [Verrucomicrobiota bacterium]|mgnify:CR=1 FL=1|jgi:hypothetical protein|nr:MAG: hypothetical protein BWX84_00245 [Verrucomicrobia bacterium ADurb.Bin118]HPY31646.1 hypothetical protein [Verrucomicrobiota bacterium]HQB17901.1 hypothetical protein [Verrucomicrobiota bacterium]